MKQKRFHHPVITFELDINPTNFYDWKFSIDLQDYEVVAVTKILEVSVGELLGECVDSLYSLLIVKTRDN